MNAQICRRAGFVCVVLALVFSVFSARLIHLQVGKHEELAGEAARTTAKKKVMPATRGKIVDANSEVLADNVPVYKVVVDGSILAPEDRATVADILARNLGMPPEKVNERIDSKRPYIVVKNGVEASAVETVKQELAAAKLRCVMYERSPKRSYPNESMLAHVLGFLDHEGRGIQGIEMMMEPYLRGEDGFVYTARDRTGREIVAYRGIERPARDGMTVQLTVDMGLQALVERELDAAYERYDPNMITAVFVRPRTGEILAMATRPTFDPNDYKKAPVETTKNRAIIEMFEPGSTFKLVVISAALNERAVSPEQQFFCDNGSFSYGGRILRDVHGYGSLSVHDILVKSSNIGCAKIAMQIGAETFHEYIRRFGFGERSGLGLPGEIAGMVHPVHKWSGLSITRIPMGHEVAVTPLQSVMCMAAIANGGEMMMPQIVRSVRDSSGEEVLAMKPTMVRRVVSEETADEVASALREVVSEKGTAPLAAIPGYDVCGKTGTAQRVDPKGGYTPGQYVVSFAGYFPAGDPEVAGIVLVDNARKAGTQYGGTIAGPIFSTIGRGMARELDLVPETGESDGTTIALVPRAETSDKDLN
jgi:cell division protein FtsI (penicillin-binding protein 3)/stage V sporulation protein D (sporulation-specific penicillin-binding protein)